MIQFLIDSHIAQKTEVFCYPFPIAFPTHLRLFNKGFLSKAICWQH